MTRPSKLNPETVKKLTTAISGGNYVETACQYAGISERSYFYWMGRGEKEAARLENPRSTAPTKDEELPYLQFLQAVSRALIDAEVRNVALINKAAQGGEEVKTRTITTRTPVKVGGDALRDEDGKVVYSEKTVIESTKAPPYWRASSWFLERKMPEKWGRQRLEVSVPDGGPIESVAMSKKDYEEVIAKRLARVAQNTAGLSEDELHEPDEH